MKIVVIIIGIVAALYAVARTLLFVMAAVSAGGVAGFESRALGAEIGGIVFSGALAVWCLSNGLKRTVEKNGGGTVSR